MSMNSIQTEMAKDHHVVVLPRTAPWPNDAIFFSLLYSLGHMMPFFQLPVDLAKALLYVDSKKHPKTP